MFSTVPEIRRKKLTFTYSGICKMKSLIQEERLSDLIKSSLNLMCKTSLSYNTEVEIKGLLGITLDKKNVFLIDVNEIITSEDCSGNDDQDKYKSNSNIIPDKKDPSSTKRNSRNIKRNLHSIKDDYEPKVKKYSQITNQNLNSIMSKTLDMSLLHVEKPDCSLIKVEKQEDKVEKQEDIGSSDDQSLLSCALKSIVERGPESPNSVNDYSDHNDNANNTVNADLMTQNDDEEAITSSQKSVSTIESKNDMQLPRDNLVIRQEKGNDPKFVCEICQQEFGRPYNLKRHMMKHTGEYIECQLCRKKCYSQWELNKHTEFSHIQALRCQLCDKTYKSQEGLRRHNLSEHVMSFKFECEVCSKGFHQERALETHFNSSHLNLHTVQCKAAGCFLSFGNRKELAAHKKIEHSDIKPENTNLVMTKQPIVQTSSERKRCNIKQYSCKKCGKTYQWASSLSYHANVCKALEENSLNFIIEEDSVDIIAPETNQNIDKNNYDSIITDIESDNNHFTDDGSMVQ